MLLTPMYMSLTPKYMLLTHMYMLLTLMHVTYICGRYFVAMGEATLFPIMTNSETNYFNSSKCQLLLAGHWFLTFPTHSVQ